MERNPLENYFREQQVSLQWLPFLRAMASELSEQTDPESLRNLFASIGQRFAGESRDAFDKVNTLGALATSLNDFLAHINWGCVEINEVPGGVEIDHFAAPLAEAFGDDALTWSLGFLEGFYQALFGMLGASTSMQVRALDDQCEAMHLRFRFGR
jgi:hypothetical protein